MITSWHCLIGAVTEQLKAGATDSTTLAASVSCVDCLAVFHFRDFHFLSQELMAIYVPKHLKL